MKETSVFFIELRGRGSAWRAKFLPGYYPRKQGRISGGGSEWGRAQSNGVRAMFAVNRTVRRAHASRVNCSQAGV